MGGRPVRGARVQFSTDGDAWFSSDGASGGSSEDGTYSTQFSSGTKVGTQTFKVEAWTVADIYVGKATATFTQTEPRCEPGASPSGPERWSDADATFGCGGTVRPGGPMVLLPDDNILTLLCVPRCPSTDEHFYDHERHLARLRPDGSPDTSFGVRDPAYNDGRGGSVKVNADPPSAAERLAVHLRNGVVDKIVVGTQRELSRYGSDGKRDTTFGGDGKVSLENVVLPDPEPRSTPCGPSALKCRPHVNTYVGRLALQPDGDVLALLTFYRHGEMAQYASGVTRLKYEDGSMDRQFGDEGLVVFADDILRAAAVAVQPDNGKIVVAGSTSGDAYEPAFSVARLLSDGALDPSFNPCPAVSVCGGRVEASFTGQAGYPWTRSVALQPDGKIVVVGEMADTGYGPFFLAMARFNNGPSSEGDPPDGTLDQWFNPCAAAPSHPCGGTVIGPDLPGWEERCRGSCPLGGPRSTGATDVAFQPDGKILVGGWGPLNYGDFIVWRWRRDGTLDTCGTPGWTRTRIGLSASASAVAVQPDGKILLAGEAGIVRYLGASAPRWRRVTSSSSPTPRGWPSRPRVPTTPCSR